MNAKRLHKRCIHGHGPHISINEADLTPPRHLRHSIKCWLKHWELYSHSCFVRNMQPRVAWMRSKHKQYNLGFIASGFCQDFIHFSYFRIKYRVQFWTRKCIFFLKKTGCLIRFAPLFQVKIKNSLWGLEALAGQRSYRMKVTLGISMAMYENSASNMMLTINAIRECR